MLKKIRIVLKMIIMFNLLYLNIICDQAYENRPCEHKLHQVTIDVEGFAGLNIRGFSSMKFFAEILSQYIGHQCSLPYLKLKIHRKTFVVSSKTTKV